MSSFKAPVGDILFSLRHFARTDNDWDDSIAADILDHFAELAENVPAPINAIGGREGAHMENSRVQMPSGFSSTCNQLACSDAALQGVTHTAHANRIAQKYAHEREQGKLPDGQTKVVTCSFI